MRQFFSTTSPVATDCRFLGGHNGRLYYFGEAPDEAALGPPDAAVRDRLQAYRDIDAATAAKIRARYSIDDEFKALRTGDKAYVAFVEACVAEGRAAKQKLAQP
jgi:hypothetical protein